MFCVKQQYHHVHEYQDDKAFNSSGQDLSKYSGIDAESYNGYYHDISDISSNVHVDENHETTSINGDNRKQNGHQQNFAQFYR